MWGTTEYIIYWADDLERLARNLEKESAKWTLPDHSKPTWGRKKIYDSTLRNFKKRADIIWFNAVEAGIIIFKLCGLGAFDERRRIKNMVCQIRSKVEQDLQKFTLTSSNDIGLHTIYSHRTRNSLDVFFVKIFEAFRQISDSKEDLLGVKIDYDNLRPLAQLHAKSMRGLGTDLKSRFVKQTENGYP